MPERLTFTRDEIRKLLADHGYTGNPEGLVEFSPVDYVVENESTAHLDINADAVRKGEEVPDRPIRITFQKVFDGVFTNWKLKSVEELAAGVESEALDRQISKKSPWPTKSELHSMQTKVCPKCGKEMMERAAPNITDTPMIGSTLNLQVYRCHCGYEKMSSDFTRHQ